MFSTPSRESPWAWKKWLQASSLCENLISSTRILTLSKQCTKCPSWLPLNLSVPSPFSSHTSANSCQTLQVVPVKFLFAKGSTYPFSLEKVEPSLAAFVHAHTDLLTSHIFFSWPFHIVLWFWSCLTASLIFPLKTCILVWHFPLEFHI